MPLMLKTRVAVFVLASLSFACLLGEFYGVWTMHWFGCWILSPAMALLVAMASLDHGSTAAGPRLWIMRGATGGVVAAIAYDLYRLPFVLAGAPLFTVFGKFGNMLLGVGKDDRPSSLALALGWSYHFSNGAALGIMFLAIIVRPSARLLFWGAVAWALCVETILLMTPYAKIFGLELNAWFIFLTASAHAIFGVVLGLWTRWRLTRQARAVVA